MTCLKILFLSISLLSLAQTQGLKVELVGHIPLEQFPTNPSRLADIWGFTDDSGHRYALVCKENGISAYDVTTPSSPTLAGDISLATSRWKDIKTYNYGNGQIYAFVTADGVAGVGLTVINLSNLPESMDLVGQFQLYTDAHNLFIDPNGSEPYAYVAITGSGDESGLITIDISDPNNPTTVSHFRANGVHDLFVSSTWANPDWNGKDMAILFSEDDGMVILDISNKSQPAIVSKTAYSGLAYSHSGWSDKTGRYIYAFDELDELSYGHKTLIRTFDILDPSAPVLVNTWEGYDTHVDHNGIVKDDFLYVANYTAGLTVLDISDPSTPQLAAQNYPFQPELSPSFNGYWGVYPLFDNDIVICSDITNGLAVLEVAPIEEPTLIYGPQNLQLCGESTTPGSLKMTLFAPNAVDLPLSVVSVPEGLTVNLPKATISSGETLDIEIVPSIDLPPVEYEIVLLAGSEEIRTTISLIDRNVHLDLFNPSNGELFVPQGGTYFYWTFNQETTNYQFSFWTQPDRSDIYSLALRQNYIDFTHLLGPNTTYYWQIQAQGLCDTRTSEVYSFTTAGSRFLIIGEDEDPMTTQAWSNITNWNGLRVEYRSANDPDFLAGIEAYDALIWFSGPAATAPGPNSQEESLLANYLDQGGSLFLNTPGYYQARGNTVEGFMRDYLGIESVEVGAAQLNFLEGNGYASGIQITPVLPDHNSNRLLTTGSATALLRDTQSGHQVAVAQGQAVYMSVPVVSMTGIFSLVQLYQNYYLEHLTLPLEAGLFRQYIPINPVDTNNTTHLYLYNLADTTSSITIDAVDREGRVISKSQPSLNGYGMVKLANRDITGIVNMPYHYLVVSSNNPVAAMMEGLTNQTGFALPATNTLYPQLYVPHVAADTTSFFTRAAVANASGQSANTVFLASDGFSWNLDFDAAYSGDYFDFATLLDGQITPSRTRGIFQSDSGQLIGSEVFGANAYSQIAGLTLSGETSSTLYFNHIANTAADWWTGMSAYNPGDLDATVKATVYAVDGSELDTSQVVIRAGNRIVDAVTSSARGLQFFPQGLHANAAWFKLESDQPLVGYTLFSDAQNRLFAGLEASTSSSSDLLLPFVGNGDNYAGIAFVNDTDSEQMVSLTLRNGSGVFMGSATVTIPAHGRVTQTGSALFGSAIEGNQTYAQLSAPLGVQAFVIYGDYGSNWLCGINALPALLP